MNNDDELDIFFKPSKVTVKTLPSEQQTRPPPPDKNQPKTTPMISMKAFFFNFKKFYKEKTRVRNLLSEASAKQRNISLKIYVRNHFNSYKDVKTMLLYTRVDEVKALQKFEELAFKNLADREDTRIYVRNSQTDQIAHLCRQSLQEIFMEKESSFYEKRIITRFLKQILNTEHYVPFGYPEMAKKFKEYQQQNSQNIQILGNFLKGFGKIRQGTFKLVDVAHYLYEYKFRRDDVQIIMNFITKVKSLYNQQQNQPKSNNIDGDKIINFKLLTTQFDIIVNKDKTNCDLIKDLLVNIRDLLNQQIKVDTLERVQKIMEQNIIGDYLNKYFKDHDHQISNQLSQIQQITELIYTIEQFPLSTKQDQLEVLLAFIHQVQGHTIDAQTASIAQKHSQILNQLLQNFENALENTKLFKHKNKKKDQVDMQGNMMPIKTILYDDDLRAEETINPYKRDYADLPIRKPKVLDLNSLTASVPNQPNEIHQAEEYIDQLIQIDYNKESLIMSQLQDKMIQNKQSQEFTNLRYQERDLLYEHEFDKLRQSSKAQSKEDMILELQHQIRQLKQEVEIQKSQKIK